MAKWKQMSKPKKIWRVVWIILLVQLIAFIIYAITLFSSFKRIPDWQNVDVDVSSEKCVQNYSKLQTNQQYSAVSYNVGFGAYLPNYSFFMDGGIESWADSPDSVVSNMLNISNMLADHKADFISLQEVDSKSTRTYNIDETYIVKSVLRDFNSLTVCCYDSGFLFWPPLEPHGKSKSNLMTLSKYTPNDSVRRQLPIDEGLTKIFDYDRCYSKTYYHCENGKKLAYYTTHMSVYSQDPTTSDNQIKQLVEDMQQEYKAGNYCICGADFNKQLVDNPEKYFSEDKIKESKPFPTDLLDGSGIFLCAPFNEHHPAGTCRNAGEAYTDKTQVSNFDGFLISANVEVVDKDIADTEFIYSDHNPVWMKFKLKG